MNKNIDKYYKGILTAFVIALTSTLLSRINPIVGSSIIALALGMICNYFIEYSFSSDNGVKFSSKRVLQIAIILLGTRLNINQIFQVGRFSVFVMIFTVSAAYISAYYIGKVLNLNNKFRSLIGTGTAVCGGSAILALSPIIEAEENDIAYAISAVFLFDVIMIVLFPLMGRMLNLSDLSFGLWAGTAINDTSSVVAAGYAFSNIAGNYATIVKLTRTTAIIPITLVFSIIVMFKDNINQQKINVRKITNGFPWFILLFLLSAIVNSLGLISVDTSIIIGNISKFLMTMALGAVGLKTDLKKMISSGVKPIVLGFIVSTIVVVVSILVQYFIGNTIIL